MNVSCQGLKLMRKAVGVSFMCAFDYVPPEQISSNKVVPQLPFRLTPPLRPAAPAESIPAMCQTLCEESCVWETLFKALHRSCITQHYVWCANDRCGVPPVWWNSVGLYSWSCHVLLLRSRKRQASTLSQESTIKLLLQALAISPNCHKSFCQNFLWHWLFNIEKCHYLFKSL